MDSKSAAAYLEDLAKKVRDGAVIGVSVVETDQNGVVRMRVLCTPEGNILGD